MAKYINKDQAYKIVLHYGSYVASTKIADMPSIDLVRCKDCALDAGCKFTQYKGRNGYCSYGERKEAEA